MFYTYFNGPIFPSVCLFVLILGAEALMHVKTKLKEMLLWCFHLLVFSIPPSPLWLSLFTFRCFMPLFSTNSEDHSKANQLKALLNKIYVEIIETNRLDTALHDSRLDRRPARSPPHCQGDIKSWQALVLPKVWTMASFWTLQHNAVAV